MTRMAFALFGQALLLGCNKTVDYGEKYELSESSGESLNQLDETDDDESDDANDTGEDDDDSSDDDEPAAPQIDRRTAKTGGIDAQARRVARF